MCFNEVSPHVEFRLHDCTTSLATLLFKLNELMPNTENIKVRKIEFYEDWIDTDRRVKYNLIKSKADEDVKDIWRSFHRRLTKGSIKLDAKVSRSVDDIIKMMKRLESSESV